MLYHWRPANLARGHLSLLQQHQTQKITLFTLLFVLQLIVHLEPQIRILHHRPVASNLEVGGQWQDLERRSVNRGYRGMLPRNFFENIIKIGVLAMRPLRARYAPATRPLLAVDFSHENPIIAR